MAIFEVEANGKMYEVDAPDINAAVTALRGGSGGGGQFADTLGQNFRTAREGVSPPAPREASLTSAITDIPREVYDTTAGALSAAAGYLNPFSAERRAKYEAGQSGIMDTGRGLAAALSVPAAPFVGVARSLLGHPLAVADEALQAGGAALHGADRVPQPIGYEGAKGVIDTAISAAMPARGGLSTLRPPQALPPAELAKVPTPTSKELLSSGGQRIEAADKAATGDFSPQIMEALSQDMRQALNPKRERIAPQTFGLVDDLAKDTTLTGIRTTRELLNEVRMSPDGKERRAAKIAIDRIDEFLARNEPLAAQILKEGQADYAAGKRTQMLEQADAVSGLRTGRAGYGGNEVNARRQVISPIVEKYIKGNTQGFTKEEITALTDFVEGSKGVNTLRTLAQMAPSKGGLGFSSGILPVATLGASLAVGSGANKLAALMTRNQFQSLIDKMAKRSPAYENAIAQATNKFLAAAAAVQQQPTPAKIGALVMSSRALSNGLKFDGIQISAGELLNRMQSPATGRADED